MSFLYKRTETPEKILIVFPYYAVHLIAFFATVVALVFIPKYSGYVGIIYIASVAMHLLGLWKPRSEIKQAMKKGMVGISGSRYSFIHPLTYEIKK
jgi:hypothetical protein